ncbi:MAG: hypothetical protein ACRD16_00925, partial [Thermoanaerobaculia bacterium]
MTVRLRSVALLGLLLLAGSRIPAGANLLSDIQQVQGAAEAVKAQADACARMKCPVADCAALAKMMQALVDAETIMDALHNALIDA